MNYIKIITIVSLSLLISIFILEITINLHRKNHSPGAIFSQSMIDYKLECLQKIEGNKIIFIGGSNVAYGIDCKLVREKMNLNAMNFGCMVGLGPEILFENVSEFLKPGDSVVLCWEYETYRFDRRSQNLNYLGMMLGPQKVVFEKLPLLDRFYLKLHFPLNLIRYSIFSLVNSTHDLKDIYKCGWTFDELGNVTSNLGTTTSKADLENSPLAPLISEHEIHQDLKLIANKILEFSNKHKVKIYVTWPNTYRNSSYNSNRQVATNLEIYKSFWKNLGVEVLGEPEDAMLPEQYFYDSVYHLNRKGTELRTLKLIDELLLVQ